MFSEMKAILPIEPGGPMAIQARFAAFTRPPPLIYFTVTTNTIAASLNRPSSVDGTAATGTPHATASR